MADKRVRLTLQIKAHVIAEKEKKKTIDQIIESVFTKFQLTTSKRAIFRTLANKKLAAFKIAWCWLRLRIVTIT